MADFDKYIGRGTLIQLIGIWSIVMDGLDVVASLLACWRAQDVEETLRHCSDDVVYSLNISEETVPFGGEANGKAACRQVLKMMLEQYDYLRYEPSIVGLSGMVVRVQTSFRFRHRLSGEILEGSMRTVFTTANGLVIRVDEYLDEALVAAFIQLTRHREEMGEIIGEPENPEGNSPAQHPDTTKPSIEKCK